MLTCKPLPAEESEFFEQLGTYFPCIYDIKFLMKSCKNLKGGLQEVAGDLGVCGNAGVWSLYDLRLSYGNADVARASSRAAAHDRSSALVHSIRQAAIAC